MKIYADIVQGSDEWFKLRMGIPTASAFDQIVTPKKCELSKSAAKYALRLCAERLLNMPTESFEGQMWMERGKELEPVAVRQYEFANDVKTSSVGLIMNDSGTMACSPDRIVLGEQKVALEVKCPSPHVHLGYLLDGAADEYKPQVQGQILIAELDRADLYSYHPRMPPATIQTFRDEEYIGKLTEALHSFSDNLAILMERAKKLGVYQALEKPKSPAEVFEANELHRDFAAETDRLLEQHGFSA